MQSIKLQLANRPLHVLHRTSPDWCRRLVPRVSLSASCRGDWLKCTQRNDTDPVSAVLFLFFTATTTTTTVCTRTRVQRIPPGEDRGVAVG